MKDFKFIMKKSKDNANNVLSLHEVRSLLGISQLENTIKELRQQLDSKSDITKETLLDILKGDILLTGQPFNISNAANIEKNTKIGVGTIYYNSTKGFIRIKKKEGWTNI